MNNKFFILILSCIFVVFLLTNCRTSTKDKKSQIPDSTLSVKYAAGFSVAYFVQYKRVTVFNPWRKETVLATYYLVADSTVQTPADGVRLQIPLQNIGITSCTQIEFLSLLGVLSSVRGVCTPELIYNPALQQAYQQGGLAYLGDGFRFNLENLLMLQPEALMLTRYSEQEDENMRRLKTSGIVLIYNNEWLESSLLARAEWIKFAACFFNQEQLADSLFNEVEKNYLRLKTLAQTAENKPSIVAGGSFKGTWYMPSGRTFMGKLYEDAGGTYHYAKDTSLGSLPLNFETVLLHQQHADVWLNAQANSIAELLAQDSRYGLFDAVQNRRVYSFNAKMSAKGANDFWESGLAHPDNILSDVIWALHPDLLPNYQPIYIQKIP
ncbi:MAG: ABC transporter substrate-binding protein [Lentimicrobiaceae bacterium]|nr:ABC transporter substrate-binding protein [Lentimicrobiaceae bacterium]